MGGFLEPDIFHYLDELEMALGRIKIRPNPKQSGFHNFIIKSKTKHLICLRLNIETYISSRGKLVHDIMRPL